MYRLVGIVIILFLMFIFNIRRIENNMLDGFWTGSPSFMQDAELTVFLIHINSTNSEVPGYIIMANEEGLIINNPVKFNLSRSFSLSPNILNCKKYSIDIDWLDDEEPSFFPSKQTLYYYPLTGKIIISDENEATAILYKDYVTSDFQNIIPKHLEIDNGDDSVYSDGD